MPRLICLALAPKQQKLALFQPSSETPPPSVPVSPKSATLQTAYPADTGSVAIFCSIPVNAAV